ncbi:acyl transferase domain-containing protein [Saccharopolyspora erythraea NRRL 2338]|uniref:beta-ketoacyl synthase N-terminal-like domain-containing protein n=1 Tax=Saccharopolyspora erythraea TaxID=1836 RepID=UPI000A2F69DF|nr:beta-ketoacyl synthase N-terminal-like domain-containing protein [Saccharopolyspora erythraea]PFG95404.1 acyl transferase domain-containing protein [Saccharopolyspora erythraea NRRL 2338]QRK92043.1 polyketide synthase dehydratase domain-containing protein [Saccharopolyspora erythraea]
MSRQEPVAIVGMAAMFPGAPDLDAYWHNLVTGVDAITDVPHDRRDPDFHDARAGGPLPPDRTYCHRGGFLTEPVSVDAGAFGIMPNSVEGMEPDQLIALKVAADAVADAGGRARLRDRDRVGVVLGRGGYLAPGLLRYDQRVRTVRQVLRTLSELMPSIEPDRLREVREALLDPLGPVRPESTIGLVPNLVASRVANRLDFGGIAYTVDAACASSLVAVDHAVRELTGGRCDVVLAGGVHHCHDDTLWSMFTQLGALSPSQRIRPLSREADGLLIGEGTGVVVLKRLADARRDGDRVYAVIRGVGGSSDGRRSSLLHPDSGGQLLALRRAWEAAGLDPAEPGSVGLLEAHGTATRAGDEAEISTLAEVFGGPGGPPAVIGSVKSMIGHALPAAGIAGLIKAALAVHHRTLLPTLHCADPNPLLETTRFGVIDTARPWEDTGPRRAAVNAFGFGGVNAHVVLEEWENRVAGRVSVREPERILRVCASGPEEMRTLLDRPDRELLGSGPVPTGPCRMGIADPTAHRLSVARKVVARGQGWRGRNDVWFTTSPLLEAPDARTAFVFPGLEAEFAPRCADVAVHFGLDVPEVSDDDLSARAAAVSGVGRLLATALRRLGVRPDGLAGHSIGEWTAMVVAGMQPEVSQRGALERFWPGGFEVPEVDFVALGCSAEEAGRRIRGLPELVVSHDNAPRQSIVCGSPPAVRRLAGRCRADGVFATVLPFRSGFHTPMFEPYLAPFARLLAELELRAPEVPVWSATTAAPYPAEPGEIRERYLEHLVRAVRFRDLTEAMHAAGFRVFVQMGPGQLASFIADTLGDRPHLAVSAGSARRDGMAQLRRVLTALWVEGAAPDFDALDGRTGGGSGTVRLSTGTRLLSVAPHTRGLLDRAPGVRPGRLGGGVAAEFDGLLEQTRQAAVVVAEAAAERARRDNRSAPLKTAQTPQSDERTAVLPVSLRTMPYLRDHRFFRQRADWPDETDRRPVVPATTLIDLVLSEVERAWPGGVVVAVHDARFHRWLVAAPDRDVPVRMRRDGAMVSVSVGEFASMAVEIAGSYPRTALCEETGSGAPAPMTASEVYRQREMFHGPGFQGLTDITSMGPEHISGEITAPAAPGALLDNAGQLLGCWLMAREPDRLLAFPSGMGRITFFGPQPPPGAHLSCHVRARTPDSSTLEMDAHLVHKGQVWVEITAWRDVRLECDRRAHRVYAFPQRNMLSERRPGGWTLVEDRWPGPASRDIYAGIHLSAPEREVYDGLRPGRQRHWLLGRIAVKDAVRSWLWQHGERSVYPAEIHVRNDERGRPYVTGRHRELPAFAVSLAHSGDIAVALVRAGAHGPATGIDAQQVTPMSPALRTALTGAEHELLASLAGTGDEALWFTRFWAAKEAVGKALGTGLAGTPQDLVVVAADRSRARVSVRTRGEPRGRAFVVEHVQVSGRSANDYVVTWTVEEQREITLEKLP